MAPFRPRHRRRVIRKRAFARRPQRRPRGAARPFARSGRGLISKPMSQYGTVTETITLPDLSGNTPFQYVTTLSNFPRSQAVTALYQFYRLKYVEFKYIPKYPLGTQITATDPTTIGRPMRLFYMMNRQGVNPISLVLQNFEEKGCKPIPFGASTARAVVVRYKPSLTNALNIEGAQDETAPSTIAIEPVFNRWVNRFFTDNSASGGSGVDEDNNLVEYQGHLVWIDDFNNAPAVSPPVSELRCTAVWEYKNPYMPQLTPPEGGIAVIKN